MPEQHIPAKLRHEQLVEILTEILEGVKSGDTLEGSISFLIDYDASSGLEPITWDVEASYRIGNLQGQGGTRIVGSFVDINEPEETPSN